MTTGQIIILAFFGIIFFIGLFGSLFSEKSGIKDGFIFISAFSTSFFALIAIVVTIEMNNLRKQLKGKCPEYEKLENVYKLKE